MYEQLRKGNQQNNANNAVRETSKYNKRDFLLIPFLLEFYGFKTVP